MSKRIVVLASGGGSNFEALATYFDALGASSPGQIVAALSDRRAAGVIGRAEQRGIAGRWLSPADRADLGTVLADWRADIVVLAGYLKNEN